MPPVISSQIFGFLRLTVMEKICLAGTVVEHVRELCNPECIFLFNRLFNADFCIKGL